jgi:uncharacterized protein with PIN domain
MKRGLIYSERERACLEGQSAMFAGAGVTVQAPLFAASLETAPEPRTEPPCEHSETQPQRRIGINITDDVCTSCGTVIRSYVLEPVKSRCGTYTGPHGLEKRCERTSAFWLLNDEGRLNPGGNVCAECGASIVSQFREHLNETWSLIPIVVF